MNTSNPALASTNSASTTPQQYLTLPNSIVRNLQDKLKEKRKQGAMELEQLVKTLYFKNKDTDAISKILYQIKGQFCESQSVNQRKGGLWALATIVTALQLDSIPFLDQIIPIVLHCVHDADAKIRFHACESLYNIVRVIRAKGNVLYYFETIFDAMCKLSSDADTGVKNANALLDRLMKDIIIEDNEIYQHKETQTEYTLFQMDQFIQLVKERIWNPNPFVRQFLVGWIMVLDSVPDLFLIEYLNEFLSGLFSMLSDENREIVQQVSTVLQEFLIEIQQTTNQYPHSMLTPNIITMMQQYSHCALIVKTGLEWLHVFLIKLPLEEMIVYSASIVELLIQHVGHKLEEIRNQCKLVEMALEKTIHHTASLKKVLHVLVEHLKCFATVNVASRLCILHWLLLLLSSDQNIDMVLEYGIDTLFLLLLQALSDSNEKVVSQALQALSLLSTSDQKNFTQFTTQLLQMFKRETILLQKSSFIIRQLCIMMNPDKLYKEMAQLIEKNAFTNQPLNHEDVQFVSTLIQVLNMTLLTSNELRELRNSIRNNLEDDMFETLYKSWCYNPIATLELCLLAKAYQHASKLVIHFSQVECTVPFLVQIDNCIQLIESPVFSDLRFELLEPQQHPSLLKTLYGLLMLLPVQSSAYDKLYKRLQCVQTLSLLNLHEYMKNNTKTVEEAKVAVRNKEYKELMDHFVKVQEQIKFITQQEMFS